MFKSIAALTLYLFSNAVFAGQPSLDSVERLLVLIRAEAQLQHEQREFAGAVRAMVEEELRPYRINQVQREIAESLIQSLGKQIDREFSWKMVRPVLFRAYQESFNQSEVDELIAIFMSPNPLLALQRIERANVRGRQLFGEQLAPAKARMIAEIRDATRRIGAAQ